MSELKSIELVILAALSDQARYGYELVQRIEAITEGRTTIRPGNLYRVLHRLSERGLVEETSASGAGDDERRRYFRATARGKRVAAEELAMYQTVLRRTPALKALPNDV